MKIITTTTASPKASPGTLLSLRMPSIFFALLLLAACQNKPAEATEESPASKKMLEGVLIGDAPAPAGLSYQGTLAVHASWRDSLGENHVLISETDITYQQVEGDEFEVGQKELFVQAYQQADGAASPSLLWSASDKVDNCELDLSLSLIRNSVTVTDLDQDGLAEFTFMYQKSCKGDVSPDDLRLLMMEGEQRYEITGVMGLKMEGTDMSPVTEVGASFRTAPAAFLTHAQTIWSANNTVQF